MLQQLRGVARWVGDLFTSCVRGMRAKTTLERPCTACAAKEKNIDFRKRSPVAYRYDLLPFT